MRSIQTNQSQRAHSQHPFRSLLDWIRMMSWQRTRHHRQRGRLTDPRFVQGYRIPYQNLWRLHSRNHQLRVPTQKHPQYSQRMCFVVVRMSFPRSPMHQTGKRLLRYQRHCGKDRWEQSNRSMALLHQKVLCSLSRNCQGFQRASHHPFRWMLNYLQGRFAPGYPAGSLRNGVPRSSSIRTRS